ncbi:hypothetical protein EXU85_20400 [Spirosoma sp. KCTC 42546]|uniref:hypothetical protein n=1 Tax=Spirosoma sp. KCTC 42546 TaxID=2520506 RepID=UPI0011598826|nr:hypothetical protein [Spirosoma sp. KCTC 42546]QDK80841.1 hypothetical protein EXU85_20400 [Spirosoma sp. KCTC 42546]
MIGKWIIGAILAIAIGYLLFTYVPGFRFWEKQRAEELANRDKLELLADANVKLIREFADFKAKIERDKQRSDDRQASVLPNIKVDVSGLSAIAQRQANLENLIRSNLLTPADTSKVTPVVAYNEPANKAITIKLRLFDSLQTRAMYIDRAYSSLNQAFRFRGDSMRKARDWIDEEVRINLLKGWFTGKNKLREAHIRKRPF